MGLTERGIRVSDRRRTPVILGEVLFDRFPDGREILGGAPFNVAWHLRGFGLAPRLVTRLGDDDAGARALRIMTDWGLDTDWVQTDPERATGRVEVHLEGQEASFDIPAGQAFDRIAPPRTDPAAGDPPPLLYHGSLALREGGTDALAALRPRCEGVFMDVNLRDPWWSGERLQPLLDAADWVKLNHHELARLGPDGDAAAFCRRHGLRGAVITEGAHRIRWYGAGGVVAETVPPRVTELADTVGAGDAFSAVSLVGLAADWRPQEILDRAAAFAADVCRQHGATAADPELYDRAWRGELRSGSCEDSAS